MVSFIFFFKLSHTPHEVTIVTNGPAGPETPDPLFSLFICFFFSLFSMYVRVRSRAYMPDMSKNREAYKAKFLGKKKR